nr:monodehydroascorbate reductase [Tanacetum cinerariifolium]
MPSIYIQQFWDAVRYDKTDGCYKCQLDEQWFDLTKHTLRDALRITPVNNNNAFSSPSSSDALINFVNNLGYPKVVKNLSNFVTNDMFQPAPVLQILWGIVNRAHIDYAERIWEEFTQSIHTFIKDKKTLAQHTHEKKKATLIVILSIKFTKLIIYYLQRKHKFHPRPDSPFHLPNEEPIHGYLKFIAKGTKREVFGIPIPGNLIIADIKGEPYYQEYLEKVAKHQRYLAGEKRSNPDSPAPKPAKATKKSKPSAPKADLRPPVTKLDSSQQPEPKPTPAKSKGKKRLMMKRLMYRGNWRNYDAPRGLLPPVVSLDLLTLQTQKKKSHADQFIFQRHTSTPTGSFGHDESSSLYAKLGLTDSEVESDEDVPGIDAGVPDEGQARPNLGFTATAYPMVQENLKLNVEEHKTTTETEAESMVFVTIQQDTSVIPPMTTPKIDLTSRPNSPNVHQPLQGTATETTTITHPPPPQPQQSTTDSMLMKRIELLKDLAEARKRKKKRRDSPKTPPRSPPHQPPPPSPSAGPSGTSRSPKASGSSQVPPPPPSPLSTNQEGQSHGSVAPSSSKTTVSVEYKAWTMTDTRLGLSVSSTPEDLQMDDDMAPDAQVHSSDDEDIRNAHIPKVNLQQDWWKPLEENRHATPEPAWSIPSSDLPVPNNNWASALASTYAPPPEDSLLAQIGDMAIFMDWFCKRQGITEPKPQDLEGLVIRTFATYKNTQN